MLGDHNTFEVNTEINMEERSCVDRLDSWGSWYEQWSALVRRIQNILLLVVNKE
jgi:hypothetical protein